MLVPSGIHAKYPIPRNAEPLRNPRFSRTFTSKITHSIPRRPEKKKALNTWEQDERQLLTASDEGMPGSDEGQRKKEGNRLDEVVQAKDQIGEKPKHKPSH